MKSRIGRLKDKILVTKGLNDLLLDHEVLYLEGAKDCTSGEDLSDLVAYTINEYVFKRGNSLFVVKLKVDILLYLDDWVVNLVKAFRDTSDPLSYMNMTVSFYGLNDNFIPASKVTRLAPTYLEVNLSTFNILNFADKEGKFDNFFIHCSTSYIENLEDSNTAIIGHKNFDQLWIFSSSRDIENKSFIIEIDKASFYLDKTTNKLILDSFQDGVELLSFETQ